MFKFLDDVFRKVVMIRLEDVTFDKIVDILNAKPIGVILMMPQVTQKDIDEQTSKIWIDIQNGLVSHKINIPILFTFEDESKLTVYEELKERAVQKKAGEVSENPLFHSIPNFEIKSSYAQLAANLELSVLYGVLASDKEFRSSSKPIVMVTASYDYMSIAPGMGKGINAASGMMGVFELSRIFSQLLEDIKLKDSADVDLMFALTPGSFMGYEPSGQFIESLNGKLKDRIKFVLCLDSLAYNNDLSMNFGSVNKADAKFAKSTLKTLKDAGERAGTQIKFNKKATAGSFYEWEHIRYSDKGFFSGTLTSFKTDTFESQYEKFSVFDNEANFDEYAFEKNIRLVAEFLLHMTFPNFDSQSDLIGEERLFSKEIMMKFLEKNPREPTQLNKDSKLTQELHRMLKFHIKNTKIRKIRVDGANAIKFYEDMPLSHEVVAYNAKPQLLNLTYAMGILAAISLAYYLWTNRPTGKAKRD